MNLVQTREFTHKYYKFLLFSSLLFILVLDLFVISQRRFHFSSVWWTIIQNVESGNGYKGCDADYIPNCPLTDQVTAMREPIPVFFFALIGKVTQNSRLAFQFSQVLLNLTIGLLIYLLTQELTSRTLGVAAAFCWAFYIQAVHTVMTVNGDLIAGFLVLLGILCLTRALKNGSRKDWVLFGILFGLAVLSRSSTLFVFLILAAGAILSLWRSGRVQRSWRALLLAGVLFGLVIAPWVIRNEIVFGKPILGTTLVGYNLYRHNAILAANVSPHYVGPSEGLREITALVARTPELRRPINEARVDEIFQGAALAIIRAHPKEYLKLAAFRFLPLWFNFGVLDQYNEAMDFVDDLVITQQAMLLVAFLIAIWKGDQYLRLLAASVLFFMLGYLAIDSQLRYMIVIMPVVIVISVVGFDRYIRLLHRKQQRQ